MTDERWRQASLPISLGGFGIRSCSSLAIPAYLSSITATSALILSFMPQFNKPADYNIYIAEWKARTSQQQTKDASKQDSWDKAMCRRLQKSLLEGTESPIDRARLQAITHKYAGAWLKGAPNSQIGTFLNDDELQLCSSLRLGAQLFKEHSCKCGSLIDAYGHHCFSCHMNNGRYMRHQAVNSIISRALSSINLPNQLEPANLAGAPHLRPDGITILPYKNGKSLAWDVTFPHTLNANHIQRLGGHVGSLANDAEARKCAKYQPLCDRYIFEPVAIETFEAYGKRATNIVQHLARHLTHKTGDPREGVYIRHRISIAIQRANAYTVQFGLINKH